MTGKFSTRELKKLHGKCKWRSEGWIGEKRIRAFFRTEEQATEYARLKNIELRNYGQEHAHIDGKLRVEALACAERLAKIGATLTQATDYYLAYHDTRTKSVTFTEAAKLAKAHWNRRVDNNEISLHHARNLISSLRKLELPFAAKLVFDVNTKELRDRLNAIKAAARSKNHYLGDWSAFFAFCHEQGWVKENPAKGIKQIRDKKTEQPGIFTVTEAAKLLEHADEGLVPMIALGLFAGIRPTELQRLDWSEINLEAKRIDIKATKSKTGTARFVTICQNLAEWLFSYRKLSGPVIPYTRNMTDKLRIESWKAAGLKSWPHDVLRHSFGSHYLALTTNADKTAHEMGHRGTQMLHKHYDNRRTREEGTAYFDIRPAAATDKIVAMA